MSSILSSWVNDLPAFHQLALLMAMRGPDQDGDNDPPKVLFHWYLRSIMITVPAYDGSDELSDSYAANFSGPTVGPFVSNEPGEGRKKWQELMKPYVLDAVQDMPLMPENFRQHFAQAVQILGFKHPVPHTRDFWLVVFHHLVKELNLTVELEEEMDKRLKN